MKQHSILYANPAGNITAIVRGNVADREARRRLSVEIMRAGRAEQVAFETAPILGGDCRIEMMGGEFCGNATRAFGYLRALEAYGSGTHTIRVEISGAPEPVTVTAELDRGAAEASMPLPLGLNSVCVEGCRYPVVHMQGIDHLIVEDGGIQRERFVPAALAALQAKRPDAAGILFCEGERLVPAVYVAHTDSLVWESSCGSGSVACAWLRAQADPAAQDGVSSFVFREPGGDLEVRVFRQNGKIVRCTLGGRIEISD